MSSLWPIFDEQSIKKFIQGDVIEPFAHRPLAVDVAHAHQTAIKHFLQILETLPSDKYACLEAYRTYEQDRLRLIELALAKNPQKIMQLNDALYGTMAELHAEEAVSYLVHLVRQLEPSSASVAQARDQLLHHWKGHSSSVAIERFFEVFDHQRQALAPLVEKRFEEVAAFMASRPEKRLDSEATADMLSQAAKFILKEDTGDWTSIVKVGIPNVYIDRDQRAVMVPAGRVFSIEHVKSLAIHEIGVHIYRAVQGEKSHEPLASYGLPGYGPAEEAMGALMGSLQRPKLSRIMQFMSFAVLEAASRPDATFRHVHEMAKLLLICAANSSVLPTAESDYHLARLAFARVIRVLRLGTSQIMDRSTTKYWRGQLLLSQYFNQYGVTEASLERFFLGKYNAFDDYQLSLLQRHRIS